MGTDPLRWPAWPASRLLFFTLLLLAGDFLVQVVIHLTTQALFLPVALGGLIGVVLPCRWLARAGGRTLAQDFHLDRRDPGALTAAVVTGAAALAPTSLLAVLSSRMHPIDPAWVNYYQQHLPTSALGVGTAYATVLVVVPLTEELLFRGLLYRLLRRVWGAGPAMIITALGFAIVHGEPWFLFGLFGLGLILAYLYEATGSLAAPLIAHAVHNGVSLSVMLAQKSSLGDVATPTAADWSWLTASLAVLAAIAWLLTRRSRRLEPDEPPAAG
jgi:membrane protease YdiL (CAAX protease family)